jgi:adenylyltransferase/sulfurtransferase
MEDISADEFADLLANQKEIQLLDVREPIEYQTFNKGGINIPLGKLPRILADDDFEFSTEKPIIVVCLHGIRSKTAKVILAHAGFKNVRNLTGGLAKLQRIG